MVSVLVSPGGEMRLIMRGGVILLPGLAAGLVAVSAGLTGAAPVSAASASATAVSAPQARPAAPGSGRTVVTFAWGGGNRSQLPGLRLFRRYHMHGTYYVPSGLVCFPRAGVNCRKSQYLTLPETRTIAADGNEIGGLTVSHLHLSRLPTAEQKRQICNDRVNLTRWGFKVTDFAYPYTVVNHHLEALAAQCGYNSSLGAGQVAGAGVCGVAVAPCLYAETIPPPDPQLIRAPVEVNADKYHWTPATFESIVTQAQLHGGGWIVFLIHDICPSYCRYGVTYRQLQQVLAWTSQRRGPSLQVKTVRQVIGGSVKPAVMGPVPPRIPPPGVNNPQLADLAGTGLPSCYQPADFGRNAASFSYHRDAGPHGEAAETVTVTSHSSGDAKLLVETDLGACSPPVTAGRSYALGTSYKSSVPAQFDVYYRNRVGDWLYWTSSKTFAAATHWARASWTTPPVPADATAISFGLATGAVGSLSTTGYSLRLAPPSHIKLIVLSLIALAVAAPLLGWRLWHPRRAPGRDDNAVAGDGEPEPVNEEPEHRPATMPPGAKKKA